MSQSSSLFDFSFDNDDDTTHTTVATTSYPAPPPLPFSDCPICLDPMSSVDHSHPLQCPTLRCDYNFCHACIQSLITSSKDGYAEASDGSLRVKVFLHCPNCRADLSDTIRDTLLLRKTDAVLETLHKTEEQKTRGKETESGQDRAAGVDDNWTRASSSSSSSSSSPPWKLTEKQMVWKQAMEEDPAVQAAIDKARNAEKLFFGWSFGEGGNSSTASSSNSCTDTQQQAPPRPPPQQLESMTSMEEWGFEMDLVNGVHDSFHMPSSYQSQKLAKRMLEQVGENEEKNFAAADGRHHDIDITLLRGLECLMDQSEQQLICDFLTSGNPDKLAEAAKRFKQIIENPPGTATRDNDNDNNGSDADAAARNETATAKLKPNPKELKKLSSIFELIQESEEQHRRKEKQQQPPNGSHNSYLTPHQLALHRRRAFLEDSRRRAHFLKKFPLPVRMPKQFPALNLSELEFAEHPWDGTVVDAYNKLHIHPFAATVSQHRTSHSGVKNILGDTDVRIAMPGTTRLVVKSVSLRASQMGIVKGDVLTHLDDRPIESMSEEVLKTQWKAFRELGETTLPVVLNAERSVAEALKRRASAIEEEEEQF